MYASELVDLPPGPELSLPMNEERPMHPIAHTEPIAGSTHVNREKTDGMLRHTRLANESRGDLQKREELRLAEMDMFRTIERVAALRRALPAGAVDTDV